MASTSWTELLNELNRDVSREQPTDVVQFGADWFQSRLKRERVSGGAAGGSTKRGPGAQISIPPPSAGAGGNPPLSPLTETGPRDSNFGGAGGFNAGSSSGGGSNSLFSSSFGAGGFGGAASGAAIAREPSPSAPDAEDDGGPHGGPASRSGGGGGISFNSSPFGAPAADADHADEPPVPSYALGRRTSVSAESLVPQNQRSKGPSGLDTTMEEDEDTPNPNAQMPSFPKSEDQLARIRAAIKPNFLFRNLDEEQERDVLAAMKEVTMGAGEMIIEQGAAGDYFYVVERGTLEVFVKKDGQVIDPEKGDKPLLGKKVATCVEGNSFGELALMHNAPRAASIISVTPATLWALDRVSFRTILLDHTSRKRRLYETFLSEVPILASLQPQERAKIADVLESRTFNDGEDVIREGDVGEEFFLIEAGSAVAVKNQGGKEVAVKQYTKGDYFGELALLNRQTRAATIRAVGPEKLRVVALGEQAFTRLLGPVKDIMARNVGERYGFAAGR